MTSPDGGLTWVPVTGAPADATFAAFDAGRWLLLTEPDPYGIVLDGAPTPSDSEPEEVRASIVSALDRLFARKEGQALVRLLADAVAGAIPSLATATRDWCDDIRAVIVVRLRADEPGTDLYIADAAARLLAPEFDALAEDLFTAALGRGLLDLPKFALPEAAEER